MPPTYVLTLQIAFSILVIVVFGYRQFNRWTEKESRGDTSDSELLAFAPPRSFTSLWRFLLVASLYCLALVVFYLLLLLIFSSPPSAGAAFLSVSGVTPQNAWLVALFVVTGLSPILPVFSGIEHAVRGVMHAWAVVPTKAEQMANELGSPSTKFTADDTFLRDTVLPRLEPDFHRSDFAEAHAISIAQKWCRLVLLFNKFAPPAQGGSAARRSPYINRFHQDFLSLEKEVKEFAKSSPALLRTRGGSPAAVALSERIDAMLHRLYVLMCCNAFAAAKSLDEVGRYFQRSYGIEVGSVQLAMAPFGPMFDTLLAVTGTVLAVSIAFSLRYPSDNHVHPFVWAACAFATHGAGLLIGWLVFGRRRRQIGGPWRETEDYPLSRNLLVTCVVVGFALATIPSWAASLYYLLNEPTTMYGLLPNLMKRALFMSWPWAFLGSATALATFIHLEHTANAAASLRTRAASAGAQAAANLAIALCILATYTPPGSEPIALSDNLARPLIQLVLALTAAIGVVLGFCLPRVVHGHGLDRRGGATRYRLGEAHAQAVFTCCGQQLGAVMQTISLTGCVLLLTNRHQHLLPGRQGVLTLHDGTALAAYVVRVIGDAHDDDAGSGPGSYAVQFANQQRRVRLAPAVRQRLSVYLRGAGLAPVA
jgi:multisubunit Na+/H+ antiporter MnhC subunit